MGNFFGDIFGGVGDMFSGVTSGVGNLASDLIGTIGANAGSIGTGIASVIGAQAGAKQAKAETAAQAMQANTTRNMLIFGGVAVAVLAVVLVVTRK